MASHKYEIREICGDWALDIHFGNRIIALYFNSRNNAELVKSILEWEDAHPNEAVPYKTTITPPNEWVSVYDRLPEPGERVLATDCGFVGEFYINKCGKWQRYNANCSELLMALDILYWMPLPAPPDRRPPEGEEAT